MMSGTARLTEHVGLIHDLLLNQLLNDVLEGDQAQHLVEGVTVTLAVDTLHKRHVALVA